jgi:hypothetical protein
MRLKTTSGAFQRKKIQKTVFNRFKGIQYEFFKIHFLPNLKKLLSAYTEHIGNDNSFPYVGPKNWFHERNNFK